MSEQEQECKCIEKCKDILVTEFNVDIDDIEVVSSKDSGCLFLCRKNQKIFLVDIMTQIVVIEKDLKSGKINTYYINND